MGRLPDNLRSRATAVAQGFNNTVASTRNNKDLTPDAKRREIAQAFQDAQQKMEQIRSEWGDTSRSTTESLTRRVFGASSASGADAISMRDAADRASRLESPGDAAALLHQAELNGDELLARAVAQRAFAQRSDLFTGNEWAGVVDTFSETRPELSESIMQLHHLTDGSAQEQRVLDEGHFYVVQPTELDDGGRA